MQLIVPTELVSIELTPFIKISPLWTLDDDVNDNFANGTWTPVLKGSTTPGSHAYFVQQGVYVKDKNKVTVDFNLYVQTWDAAAAGNLLIGGLPFAPLADAYNVLGQMGNVNMTAGNTALAINITTGSTDIKILLSGTNAAAAATVTVPKNSTVIRGQITYRIA